MKESERNAEASGYRSVIGAGDYWWKTIRAGEIFRIHDLEGNQAADTLFFKAGDLGERYSASDTIKKQGALYLTAGCGSKTGFPLLEGMSKCAR